MKTTTTPKATKATRTTPAIVDLAPKPEQDVRAGREARPTYSDIVVTKPQDTDSTGMF